MPMKGAEAAMDLGELISAAEARCVRGTAAGVRVCDVTEDSRTAVPGSLFVARRGLTHDGRAHAAAAVECGAVAVLTDDPEIDLGEMAGRGVGPKPCVIVPEDVSLAAAKIAERFYGDPSSKLTLVAITGTNGKTTVAHLVHQILNHAGVRCGLVGTVEVDDGREVAPAMMTTPPATELSRALASMVDSGCGACAIEASSHALDQRRVAGLGVDVAVFTNLTGDHQDYHKTMDAYAGAKRRLFAMLPEGGVGVFNADDAGGAGMADAAHAGVEVRWCTGRPDTGNAPVWRVRTTGATLDGLGLEIGGPEYAVSGRTRLIGAHNAMNALEAVAAADAVLGRAGMDASEREREIAAALPTLQAPRGRLEWVAPGETGPHVFIDFAHTDDALRAALESAREIVPEGGELWALFGCGGLKDELKRPRMGAVAAELADRVVVTSDNPRTERPGDIIDAILGGMPAEARAAALVHADRRAAIRAAIGGAGERDVIVLAGKGHEREQEIPDGMGGVARVTFDEVGEARAALRERRLRGAAADGKAARA